MKIEVCIDEASHAKQVIMAGADRIELCNNLQAGGTTPSYGAILQCRQLIDAPLHVLIRPRVGDFIYTKEELQQMIEDITICKKIGVDGVVIGVLNKDRNIHQEQLRQLCNKANGLEITFNRALDTTFKPLEVLNLLKKYPIHRVLSSGGASKVVDGIHQLKQMVKQSGQIQIMAGSGISIENCSQIIESTGVHAIHFSANLYQSNRTYPLSSDFQYQNEVNTHKIRTIKSLIE